MGSFFSHMMVSDVTLDFVFLPVLDAFSQVMSWLYSVADVVDKCFESIPRGPAGSSHGDFAEVEFTIDTNGVRSDQQQATVEKIRNSLKLVELATVSSEMGGHVDEQWNSRSGDRVCAVCIAEISKEEKVYKLSQCDHVFHSACLDSWVDHNHSNCPLCRTSLIPNCSTELPIQMAS